MQAVWNFLILLSYLLAGFLTYHVNLTEDFSNIWIFSIVLLFFLFLTFIVAENLFRLGRNLRALLLSLLFLLTIVISLTIAFKVPFYQILSVSLVLFLASLFIYFKTISKR